MSVWSPLLIGPVSGLLGSWTALAIVIHRGEVGTGFLKPNSEKKRKWAAIVGKVRNLSFVGGLLLGVILASVYYSRGTTPEFWQVMWTVALPSFGWGLFFSLLSLRRCLQS